MVDRKEFGLVYEGVSVETDGETIAIWKLPSGSIDRNFQTNIHLEPSGTITSRIDVGIPPEDTDVQTEDDIYWFDGIEQKSNQADDATRYTVSVTAAYLRIVVTDSAGTGETAVLAASYGRT